MGENVKADSLEISNIDKPLSKLPKTRAKIQIRHILIETGEITTHPANIKR